MFLVASVKCVGSTHGSIAFEFSNIAEVLRTGLLQDGMWIAGDEAY